MDQEQSANISHPLDAEEKQHGLTTHQAGMIGAYETRKTKQAVTIEPGRAPGAVPEREQ
jgi:hypothetical protein